MNVTTDTNSRKDGIVAAIGLLVLLIGTATGNAVAMLTMAIVALAVIALFYRQQFGRKALLALAAAACVGSAVAIAMANH